MKPQLRLHNDLQPLTYLALISINEKVSNALGYTDATNTCIKLTQAQIDAGFAIDCDTDATPKTGLDDKNVNSWLAAILNVDNTVKTSPETSGDNALANEYVAKQKAAGSKKTTEQIMLDYAQTDEGRALLNKVGSWASPLFGKQAAPTTGSVKTNLGAGNKSKGLTTTQIVLIGGASIIVLAGLAFTIYYFGIKKK